MSTATALWYVGLGRVELRPAQVQSDPALVQVQALYSGLSRGTERLVLNGRVPNSEYERMRCPLQDGAFPFPVKYGYALVGRIMTGAHAGRAAFLLHPHQTHTAVHTDVLHLIPDDVPPRRAVLTANLETAINVLWDAGVSVGDRVAIVGGGVLGCLIAAIAAAMPGAIVTLIDPLPDRRAIAGVFGAAFAAPAHAPTEQDVVIHTSGTAGGIETALAISGDEATVVEASWYGDGTVALPLGKAFHARRLKLVSSQVGRLPPDRAPRWSSARRLALALTLLRDARLDRLISAEIPFSEAPARVPAALNGAQRFMTILTYGDDSADVRR